jgi:hypothetical protein
MIKLLSLVLTTITYVCKANEYFEVQEIEENHDHFGTIKDGREFVVMLLTDEKSEPKVDVEKKAWTSIFSMAVN